MISDNKLNLQIILEWEDWPYSAYDYVQLCRFNTNDPINEITVI